MTDAPAQSPMPRGGVHVNWWEVAVLERRKRRAAEADAARLREALQDVLADIAEYERVNNLAPSPGWADCWQSVTRAKATLSSTWEQK